MAHILLVEDDSDIMRINSSFLEKEGYTVHCADSVKKAAFMLEEFVPDLVLLDVMLPDGDGMDFCKILRQIQTGKRRTAFDQSNTALFVPSVLRYVFRSVL